MFLSMLAPLGAPKPEDLIKFYVEGNKMNYCMVQNGIVINLIDWDGITPYTPPADCELHVWDGPVNIGWTWKDGAPIDPDLSSESVTDEQIKDTLLVE